MFILKLAIIILSIPFLTAISTIDAMRYGSSILICIREDGITEDVVRYWTLVKSSDTNVILNIMNKRSFNLEQCEIFTCTYNPSSMEICKLPVDPPKHRTDVEKYKSEADKKIEAQKAREALRQ